MFLGFVICETRPRLSAAETSPRRGDVRRDRPTPWREVESPKTRSEANGRQVKATRDAPTRDVPDTRLLFVECVGGWVVPDSEVARPVAADRYRASFY